MKWHAYVSLHTWEASSGDSECFFRVAILLSTYLNFSLTSNGPNSQNLKRNQPGNQEESNGLTKRDIEETMQKMLGPQPGFGAGDSAIDRFTRDLTMAARMGKLDPVICRDEEIRRCVHILSRRTKNNPVLIGESGVGKTVTVEGLAQRIVAGDVPSSLMGVKILELDLGSLTAGCMMPGEFEERLKAVITEVSALRNLAILFIDDIHNLVPAMGMQGATMMDGGSLLKVRNRCSSHCR